MKVCRVLYLFILPVMKYKNNQEKRFRSGNTMGGTHDNHNFALVNENQMCVNRISNDNTSFTANVDESYNNNSIKLVSLSHVSPGFLLHIFMIHIGRFVMFVKFQKNRKIFYLNLCILMVWLFVFYVILLVLQHGHLLGTRAACYCSSGMSYPRSNQFCNGSILQFTINCYFRNQFQIQCYFKYVIGICLFKYCASHFLMTFYFSEKFL